MPNALSNLSRQMSHPGVGYTATPEEIQAAIDVGMGRKPADVVYGEQGLQAPAVAGGMVSIDPTDYLSGNALAKLAMAAKFGVAGLGALGATAIGSRASEGAALNGLARALRGQRGVIAVPTKTEFELAHEIAQRNATLPVEQGGLGLPPNNTAMDRAKALGFDTPAYHATDADIQAFDMEKSGTATLSNTDSEWANRLAKAGIWSANEDITLAARRALGKEGGMFGDVVYPLLIENPKTTARTLDTLERKLRKGKLKNTTKVNDEEFGVTSYVVPNPSNIRSRFAAFDPMKRNSANILAGMALGGIGLTAIDPVNNANQIGY